MEQSAIRKKIKTLPQNAMNATTGAERAWKISFARTAKDLLGLTVDITRTGIKSVSLAEILEKIPENALILILEGPQDGFGLLVLSNAMLSVLVEALALGQCGKTAQPTRKPTRTDCAMLSPFLDAAMANLENNLHDHDDLTWTSDFRFASFIEDARTLELLLEDVRYQLISCEVSIHSGSRTGDVFLMLPEKGKGRAPIKIPQLNEETDITDAKFSTDLYLTVQQSRCELIAILDKISLPIANIMELAVGMELQLPQAQLDMIRLEDIDGRRVSMAKLGQNRNMRAIKLYQSNYQKTQAEAEQEWLADANAMISEEKSLLRATG